VVAERFASFTSSHFSRLPPQIEHSFSMPRLAIPPHDPADGLAPHDHADGHAGHDKYHHQENQ